MYLHVKILNMQIDEIDRVRAEWLYIKPDLDTSSMDTIGRLLRLNLLLSHSLKKTFRHFGLDAGGIDVLATLRRSGPPYELTPTDLYKRLVITSGAMTHRMDALERAGFLERSTTVVDRRSVVAKLTDKGLQTIDHAMKFHMEYERSLLTPLKHDERTMLANILKTLLVSLEAPCA